MREWLSKHPFIAGVGAALLLIGAFYLGFYFG